MSNLLFRTEDIKSDLLLELFVETSKDREIINQLKSNSPVVLVGSRGVGKSFLLRMAELEQMTNFESERILPVYLTFNKSSLLNTSEKNQFQKWMLSTILSRLIRALRVNGLSVGIPKSFSAAAAMESVSEISKIEKVAESFENSWKKPDSSIDVSIIPSIDIFKDSIEDLCLSIKLNRIALYIDEAAHIFLREQQREFFTLFRDLRFPYLTINAAVYPGVTSYGETFQPSHDANFVSLDRDISSKDYIENMLEIVSKQADSDLLGNISRNKENFAVLAFAASGNPRLLLKTINKTPKMDRNQINEVIRDFYRTDIWSEHSGLYEKYSGYKEFIDWGRNFIENVVLPDLQSKNEKYLSEEKNSTCFFWLHRDSPPAINIAMQLLMYTGIIMEHSTGIKATKSEIGTRYLVNLGCLFSMESSPASSGFKIATSITSKRMIEFGNNNINFKSLNPSLVSISDQSLLTVINKLIQKSINELDLSESLLFYLNKAGYKTIEDIINSDEINLQKVHYVGPSRAKKIKDLALTAFYEYISG